MSRRLRWIILGKVGLLSLLWIYQCTRLLAGEGMPPWGVCLMDVLYFIGMLCAWLSYMERRGLELLRGIAGIEKAPSEDFPRSHHAE